MLEEWTTVAGPTEFKEWAGICRNTAQNQHMLSAGQFHTCQNQAFFFFYYYVKATSLIISEVYFVDLIKLRIARILPKKCLLRASSRLHLEDQESPCLVTVRSLCLSLSQFNSIISCKAARAGLKPANFLSIIKKVKVIFWQVLI